MSDIQNYNVTLKIEMEVYSKKRLSKSGLHVLIEDMIFENNQIRDFDMTIIDSDAEEDD